MATIPSTTNALRHVRKTVAFDGSAGNGAVGSVAGFNLTGRVVIKYVTAYCTEAVVDAGGGSPATLAFGATGAAILATLNPADGLTINKFWTPAGAVADYAVITAPWESAFSYGNSGQLAIEASPAFTVANEAINNGTIIVDLWYFPITDDGALAGDDIDAGYMPADVKAWLATAAATPTVAGVPEVDVTHFGGTAITAAAGIPEVKVASIAAAAITAAAIATDAIDADALAADALTEIFTKIWTTALTEAYNTDGAAPTGAQALFLLMQCLTEFAISGTTLTVKKLDGSTTAMTFTLNSSTTPTSRTRAT